MSSLFFRFVYFTLDDVYKAKAVFILSWSGQQDNTNFMAACLNIKKDKLNYSELIILSLAGI